MPREGYRSITVKEAIFVELGKKAEESHRTIPEYIEHLLRNGVDFELEGDLRGLESRVQKLTDPERRAKAEALFVGLCELFGVKKEAA